MKTLWEAYKDVLDRAECSQCERVNDDLYNLENEIWCHSCLSETEYIEPEIGLTLEERNDNLLKS